MRFTATLLLGLTIVFLAPQSARAQDHKLQKGEITLARTNDPSRFALHGYAVIDDKPHVFDTVASVESRILTFTITYKANSMIGALGGEAAKDVTVQVTRDLGDLAPEGNWILRPDDSWDALIHKRNV